MKLNKLFSVFLATVFIFSACSAFENNENNETSDMLTSDTHSSDTETLTDSVVDTTGSEESDIGVQGDTISSDRCFYGRNSGTEKTETGLEPLSVVDFVLSDPANSAKLSVSMLSHSYGVAKDEKPHTISIQNQHFFDEKNFDAICYDSASDEKILYLTFDCGYENGYTSKILDTLKEKDVEAAFFCTLPQIKDNPELISRMINEGHIVGNHSVTHPDFSTLSGEQIVDEIKGFDDYIRTHFGYSSLYFRFPQGKYSEYSLATLNELGYKCVFWSLAYADWETDNQKGASYAYDTVMGRIHPGAVILLHSVSSDNANALADIIDSAREKGYEFRSLNEL